MSDAIGRLNAALQGRYVIEGELGEGGMATVYLADDLKHERKVALRVLKPELAAVVGADRFLAEIKTTANLHHPHILPLLDSGEADSFPHSPSGHIVYVTAAATLLAVPFDADRLEVTGPSVSLTEGLAVGNVGSLALALSGSGDLIYQTGTVSAGLHEFVWVTRSGDATVVDPGWSFDRGDANRGWFLSPDGQRLALRAYADDNLDIRVKELPQGPLSRLTFHEAEDKMPRWTPDGESVVFLSDRL